MFSCRGPSRIWKNWSSVFSQKLERQLFRNLHFSFVHAELKLQVVQRIEPKVLWQAFHPDASALLCPTALRPTPVLPKAFLTWPTPYWPRILITHGHHRCYIRTPQQPFFKIHSWKPPIKTLQACRVQTVAIFVSDCTTSCLPCQTSRFGWPKKSQYPCLGQHKGLRLTS